MFAKRLQLLILSGCEQEDNGRFEQRGDDYRPGIVLLPRMEVDSEDDRCSIRSFIGGISHQQSRCSKLHWVFSSA